MNKYRIADRASLATEVLEKAWLGLRKIHPQIPQAIILILSAGDRSRERGHFLRSSSRYRDEKARHEVGISPHLFHEVKELLGTMLHESGHVILYEQAPEGNQDGGVTNGYYHRKEFRDLCRKEFGLECEFTNNRHGWDRTYWRGEIPNRYQAILNILKSLPFGTIKQDSHSTTKRYGHTRLRCSCRNKPYRCIYVNMKTLEAGGIVCKYCNTEFCKMPSIIDIIEIS